MLLERDSCAPSRYDARDFGNFTHEQALLADPALEDRRSHSEIQASNAPQSGDDTTVIQGTFSHPT